MRLFQKYPILRNITGVIVGFFAGYLVYYLHGRAMGVETTIGRWVFPAICGLTGAWIYLYFRSRRKKDQSDKTE